MTRSFGYCGACRQFCEQLRLRLEPVLLGDDVLYPFVDCGGCGSTRVAIGHVGYVQRSKVRPAVGSEGEFLTLDEIRGAA